MLQHRAAVSIAGSDKITQPRTGQHGGVSAGIAGNIRYACVIKRYAHAPLKRLGVVERAIKSFERGVSGEQIGIVGGNSNLSVLCHRSEFLLQARRAGIEKLRRVPRSVSRKPKTRMLVNHVDRIL